MEENMKVCAVVVTFNRKELLINCLNAIRCQTYKPHTVLVIDNASTDGTQVMVKERGYFNELVDDISFKYLLLASNQGGAGGFYKGMRTACESPEKFDAVWVMDDDGVPVPHQLEKIVPHLRNSDYIAPLVIAQENPCSLAFNYHGEYNLAHVRSVFKEVIPDFACPFNGILYSRKLIETIGYPIAQLFIWGDERNYDLRARENGFKPVTIVDAIHVHPKDRMTFASSIFGKKIIVVPNLWKGYCFWRNTVFNFRGRANLKQYLTFYAYNAWYYLIIRHSWKWFSCFNKAYFSGFKKTPDDGYRRYMGK